MVQEIRYEREPVRIKRSDALKGADDYIIMPRASLL